MAYKRKDSRHWWGQYKDPVSGKWIRRSTGTTKKREADAIERRWQVEADHAKRRKAVPAGSIGQMIKVYFEATEDKKSADRDAYAAERLLEVLGRDIAVDTIKPSDISRYEKQRLQSVKPGTVNKEVGLFSVAFNHVLREEDWDLGRNPCEGKRLPEPKTRFASLSYEDAGKLIAAVDEQAPHTVDLIELGVQTGCRKNELLGLTWDRVDLKKNEIILREEDTKSAKARAVPLNKTARKVLIGRMSLRAEVCPSTPWVFFQLRKVRNKAIGDRIGDVRRSIKSAAKRAGLSDVTFHLLRHTCASWLAEQGVASVAIRDILGHSTIKMTDRYLHSQESHLHDAVSVLKAVPR